MKIGMVNLSSVFFLSVYVMFAAPAFCEGRVLRVGHFPNLTHAAALVEHAKWRAMPSKIEGALGNDVKIEWFTYNAGPSAMEALLVDSIDITYVGPNPAINAFVRSKGEEVRLIAGATLGGPALLVQGNGVIKTPADFRGKKIGTPQLGNTQDVAARAWLSDNGIHVTQTGGDAQLIPAENPDLLSLFITGKIDAAWTVEPWVTRIENEAKATIFLAEDQAVTTVLVSSAKALREKSDLVKAFLKLHCETTAELTSKAEESKKYVAEELEAETGRPMSHEILNSAWRRMHFSADVPGDKLEKFLVSAQKVGFLKDVAGIKGLIYVFE